MGVKYGQETSSGEWSARVEWYTQTSTVDSTALVGSLNTLDLYPDMNALIAQFTYKFGGR